MTRSDRATFWIVVIVFTVFMYGISYKLTVIHDAVLDRRELWTSHRSDPDLDTTLSWLVERTREMCPHGGLRFYSDANGFTANCGDSDGVAIVIDGLQQPPPDFSGLCMGMSTTSGAPDGSPASWGRGCFPLRP